MHLQRGHTVQVCHRPDSDCGVVAAGDHPAAIWVEGHPSHIVRMALNVAKGKQGRFKLLDVGREKRSGGEEAGWGTWIECHSDINHINHELQLVLFRSNNQKRSDCEHAPPKQTHTLPTLLVLHLPGISRHVGPLSSLTSPCAYLQLAYTLVVVHRPDPHSFVLTAACQPAAIGAEGDPGQIVGVALKMMEIQVEGEPLREGVQGHCRRET